jgi:hypothetical protein
MPLTKDFKETVRARLIRSPGFRKAVLQEAIDGLLAGDVDTGKRVVQGGAASLRFRTALRD